ncbi:MAG: sugar nucleotide-binding protein, partial [Candidatus Glassbacteria bacterium]|nr:sugar nucleotide-binding protein [Candidatus Glassbacteria bacterium]
ITGCELIPGKSGDFPSRVRRPANSALDCERLLTEGVEPPRPWKQALRDFAAAHLAARSAGQPGDRE